MRIIPVTEGQAFVPLWSFSFDRFASEMIPKINANNPAINPTARRPSRASRSVINRINIDATAITENINEAIPNLLTEFLLFPRLLNFLSSHFHINLSLNEIFLTFSSFLVEEISLFVFKPEGYFQK